MKKQFLLLSLLFAMQTHTFAQVDVISIEPVKGVNNESYFHPTFSPNGEYLLLTGINFKGLSKYDLTTKKTTKLTDADNAGYYPQVSDGGKFVVFRDVEYKNNLRYTSIKQLNLENGKESTLDKASREQHPFAFVGGKLKIGKKNTIKSKRIASDIRTVESSYILAIENRDLVLYSDDKRIVLNPNGKGSYIWASISPDEKHIVYNAIHENGQTFVCNIDGSNPVSLGYLGAPTWLGNNWIVGMDDKDDGHQIISSELKAIKIDGSMPQAISTPHQTKAMFPTANKAGDTIAFESDGTIYLLKVQTK